MKTTPPFEEDQQTLWNGSAGQAWVDAQTLLDDMFRPFENLLADAVSAASARQVLDIGCGTGSTTLAAARRLGAGAKCIGVDISQPMIATAKARAHRENMAVDFIVADAGNHAFEPASVDTIISRFGVMFFDDPVAAFKNLRRAARNGASLQMIAWRSAAENPFMTTAERAAAPLLAGIPPRKPDGPGQFAFADSRYVENILQQGGWAEIDIKPIDVVCTFPASDLPMYMTRLGPLGRILQAQDEAARHRIIDTVRPAFDAYITGAEVRYTAACWAISANAGMRRLG